MSKRRIERSPGPPDPKRRRIGPSDYERARLLEELNRVSPEYYENRNLSPYRSPPCRLIESPTGSPPGTPMKSLPEKLIELNIMC